VEGSRGVSYESRTTALRTGTETCRGSQGFYVHAIVFVGVNIGLFTINTLAGGAWWFFWPLMGWGLGHGGYGGGRGSDRRTGYPRSRREARQD
jgi:hypothetical protein